MSLEISGVTIPILSAARAAQWIYVFTRSREEYPHRAAADFLDEAGGTSWSSCAPVFNTSTTFWTKHSTVLGFGWSCACRDLMGMAGRRAPSRSDTGSPVMELEHYQSGWQPKRPQPRTSEIIQRMFLCSLLQPTCRRTIIRTKRRRPSADYYVRRSAGPLIIN